ncbi:MAG: hypothetical protein AB7I79_03090 [Rhizobiaceae bacterium]
MARKGGDAGQAQRMRQRRYRCRLALAGRPEASAVDVAVAGAVAVYAGHAAKDPAMDARALRRILRDTVARLVDEGYDPDPARAVVIRRIGRYGHAVPPGLGDPL